MSKKKNISKYLSKLEEVLPAYIELYFFKEKESLAFWEQLNSVNRCYIFGGFIVDFLKKKRSHRDIDIVIENLNDETRELINYYNGIKNSFGGYKLNIGEVNVDIWAIKDTWAIRKMNYLDFDLSSILPSTSFFNSTAVIYSIQDNKLIFKNSFETYIKNKTLDIIFEDNPYPELCIIKSYENVLDGAQLSDKLLKYIVDKFPFSCDNLNSAQLKHYGEIKYKKIDLIKFYESLVTKNRTYKPSKKENLVGQLALFETRIE